MPLSTQLLDTAKIIILAALLVVGVQYVFAWTGPTGTPPANNVDAPVNVSNSAQVKLGNLGVTKLTAGVIESIGSETNIFTGAISASAGIFSGAVSGTSLDAGSGAVTAGQGTFTGGLTVGTPNGAVEYLKMDNKSGIGDPDGADCAGLSDGGKMFFDSSIGVLYLCMQGRSVSGQNGWKPVYIDYASTQQ